MKYILRLFLFLFLITVVGCRKAPQYRIGVSQCSDDDWRQLMNEEIQQEIMFYPEASVEIRSASDDNATQISDVRYFIDNDFDIIIVAPNEAEALTPIIKEAYNKGIPVLVFDRSVNGDSYTAFQGANNAEIGSLAAGYASTLLPEGGKAIELTGLPGSTPAAERGRGFHERNDSLANPFNIVASVSADWNYDNALRVTDSLLTLYPDINLIYAHNDRMAIGASEIAEKKGVDARIIGVDAAPHIGMQAVADGKIDATFIYPTEGQRLIRTAMAILNGEPYERTTLINVASAVDSSNVELLMDQNRHILDEYAKMKTLKGEIDSYWSQHNSQKAFLYASIAALVLLCIILFLVLRSFWQHRRHKEELLEKNRLLQEQRDLEKDLNHRLAEATQSKLTFFTNVSHDLRTPLTLIADPVEQLSKAPNLTERQHVLMRLADRNVKILRRLINQILDFRKFENGKLDLNLEEANPEELAREWTDAFRPLASRHHIDFTVETDLPKDFTMAFDVEKVERVVFNLLSNAFKYTPVKGRVAFRMSLKDDTLRIEVEDTGRGISAENLENIFSSFYQVDKVRPQGSGIGLSLAKAFVELHEGTVTVKSEPDRGSLFTVTLPVRHAERRVTPDSLALSCESAREVVSLIDDPVNISEPRGGEGEAQNHKPVLLVIDDNEDVRILIETIMRDDYHVVGAPDGKTGIRLAARMVPDLIICDVMMPGIDGMETCAAIKEEISTSHIPVLMLTACSLDEQRVEGYESGADGYMAKPFNSDVLKARVASLIANRRRLLKASDSREGNPVAAALPPAGAKDRESEFYARFIELVGAEMGNMDLSVDGLADKMGMGRSQFYRKIKALTNLSPVELIRDLRLKRARDLLLSTDKSISEIAYEVGFSTPAYFTKCYREVYSETPSALREKMK